MRLCVYVRVRVRVWDLFENKEKCQDLVSRR